MTQYDEIITDYLQDHPVFTRQELQARLLEAEPRIRSWHHAMGIVHEHVMDLMDVNRIRIIGTAASRLARGQRCVLLYSVMSHDRSLSIDAAIL